MPDLEKWIQEQLDAGYSQDQILKSLQSSGYSQEYSKRTLQKVLNSERSKSKPMFSRFKGLIGIVVILLVILVAGTYYLEGDFKFAIGNKIQSENETVFQMASQPNITLTNHRKNQVVRFRLRRGVAPSFDESLVLYTTLRNPNISFHGEEPSFIFINATTDRYNINISGVKELDFSIEGRIPSDIRKVRWKTGKISPEHYLILAQYKLNDEKEDKTYEIFK